MSECIVARPRDGRPRTCELEAWQEQQIFLFPTGTRLALGPTQPPVQWVLAKGTPSSGIKWLRFQADHSHWWLRMHGSVPPFCHMPSLRVQRKLYF